MSTIPGVSLHQQAIGVNTMISKMTRPLETGKWAWLWAVGLALLIACMAARAAAPSDWWLDIANDRVEDVKDALAQGENPNALNPDGLPALMLAIRENSWRVYDLLLAHKRIDVNIENRNHETPLMYMAIVGDVKRAQALIKRGAHVNRLGWTPLHYAASKGNLKMVEFLLANKAIVNAPSPDGTTPLMMAAFSGSEDVVRTLLYAGADSTTLNLKKQSAADWARLRGHDSLAAKLDQLSQKVLAERRAQRTRDRAAGAAGQADEAGNGVGQADGVAQNNSAPGAAAGNGGPASDSGAGQGAPSASPGFDPNAVKAVDIRPPEAVPPAQVPAPKKPSEDEGNSTSRYFNLDRFDKDPAY